MGRKYLKNVRWLIVISVCLMAMLSKTQSVEAANYNAQAAINYAKTYAYNYNPAYAVRGSDCANFVSQCISTGGIPQDTYWNPNCGTDPKTGYNNWYTTSLKDYLIYKGYKVIWNPSPSQILPGNPVFYSYNANYGKTTYEGTAHAAICVSNTSGSNPMIAAHSSNHDSFAHANMMTSFKGCCTILLNGGSPNPTPPDDSNPGAPYPVPTSNIQSGSKGDQVKWVQKFANDVMGAGISVDGVAGNQTVYAIKVFQQNNGLTADGIAGTQTINKMLTVWREHTKKDKIADLGTGFCAVISRQDIAKPIYNTGSNVVLGDGSEATFSKWLFIKQGDGSYIIQSLYNGTVLDAQGKGTSNGTSVISSPLNGGDNQKWYFYKDENGYRIVPKHAGKMTVDVAGAGTAKGTNIQLCEKNGTVAQRFAISKETYNALQNIIISDVNDDMTMTVGSSKKMEYMLTPVNTQSNMVKWSSSDERVAKVDASGNVTALVEGTVTISCISTWNSNIKDTVVIHVKQETTEAPTTEAPTTEAPTTEVPTTEAPTTEAPTTEAPTTEAPTTEAPTTEASTTELPPTTELPTNGIKNPNLQTDAKKDATSGNTVDDIENIAFPLEEGSQITLANTIYEVVSDDEDAPAVCLLEDQSNMKKISIPATIQWNGIEYQVVEIGDYAFEGNKNLTSVVIGKNIEIIGEAAFMNCKNLKKVSLGTGLNTIEKKAFYNCKKLSKLNIYSRGIRKIGKKAFSKTSGKLAVKIPANKKKVYKKLLRKAGLK